MYRRQYSLPRFPVPPDETLTQRRVKYLHTIMTTDWSWNILRYGHGVTSIMALRFPMMYSGKSLQDIVRTAKFPNMTSTTGFYHMGELGWTI